KFHASFFLMAAVAAFALGLSVPAAAAFKPIPFTVGVFFATFAVTAFLFRFFPPRFDSTNAGPRAAARKFPLGAAVFGSFFAAFFFLGFHLFAVRHSFNSFRGELMFAGESAFGSVAA